MLCLGVSGCIALSCDVTVSCLVLWMDGLKCSVAFVGYSAFKACGMTTGNGCKD